MRNIFILFMLIPMGINAQEYSPVLEDNSFFIEEAYNQEAGIYQHIFKGEFNENKDFAFIFTEEMPIFTQLHQFSFEIAYLSLKRPERNGIGDLSLQYRFQLFDKENWAAAAPAFAVVIPAGITEQGLGTDIMGYEFLIPVSKRLSEHFTAHLNAGVSYFPDDDFSSTEFFGGGSIIWLALSKLNFHLEYLFTHSNEEGEKSTEHLFVPGVRYGIDIGSLQIVPGLAAAVNTTRDTKETVVLYLSFEHPL